MGSLKNATGGRGSIRSDELMPVAVFMRRLGIGRHSLAALRKRGLPVRMIGNRAMVDGQEALAALRKLWATEAVGDGKRVTEG